jgi:glycerol-3-phosphate responsive antiterminator
VDQNEHIKILNDRIKKIDEETKEIYLRKDVINGITDTKEKRIYKYLYDQEKNSFLIKNQTRM